MNKDAFQTWLLGFVSACGDNPPNREQWNTLLEAVKQLHKHDTKVYPPKWTYTADFTVDKSTDGSSTGGNFEIKKDLLHD